MSKELSSINCENVDNQRFTFPFYKFKAGYNSKIQFVSAIIITFYCYKIDGILLNMPARILNI